ncbi:glycoside hydrolase family 31 protein [Botryobasidium botryosum FD-172 SS1]|uniref:beta-glucosidase n=1 Tax=Botryobasidium botryosum (strain FD-172 SS1) TaxID=930990 RepID=A0A067M5X0_BOTB1|nr:glycoside hydrolase family 31 protein [Botryobasidium botryosum FD-172 SS1]
MLVRGLLITPSLVGVLATPLVQSIDVHTPRAIQAADPQSCPGYTAMNVNQTGSSFSADLVLAGEACNVYGPDLTQLKLTVTYEESSRIHVKIADPEGKRYQVPESVLPRPSSSNCNSASASILFKYIASPFSFSIVRNGTNEVLFDTSSYPLIFEPQYLRIKTSLPQNANIYGLGEHSDPFHLPHGITCTMWARDAYGIPVNSNLYSSQPMYLEHRSTSTHGVFLLNSNGMDIKLSDEGVKSTLEYNIIGGILDFHFLSGSNPADVARQYAEIVGLPAEMPYWGFGFHQCRYGYKDYVNVATVIGNYEKAGIPLETMWTDIDYMDQRKVFTNNANYFPTDKMREIVDQLHEKNQHYILMVDPAVAYQPDTNYTAYDEGIKADVFMKRPNGTTFKSVVWPGVTVFPDWFHPNVGNYWTEQFLRFFDKDTGIDIDGAWIDMNDPATFCDYPCIDPFQSAQNQSIPPPRLSPPPALGTLVPPFKRAVAATNTTGLNYLEPPYHINNTNGAISDLTAYTDIIHANGLIKYDTHNIYGHMMAVETRKAMLMRRPGKRPIVITHSTYAGTGHHTGKWLGDNLSQWDKYRSSIAGMLGMASIAQVPMVGSDVCGFGGNTTENLCARWAMLGAFYPFYRNHNQDVATSQEFYLWASVTQAAKNAIDMRYRLLDYIYTAFHQAHVDGSPVLSPLFYKYPKDSNTFGLDLQFFYGDSILVSPVTDENSTSVSIYLPKDIFYDFLTYAPVQGQGANVQLTDVGFTTIPVHIRGGAVLPLRTSSAMTTFALRQQDFNVVVAPGTDGKATGSLYLDDGESITPSATTEIKFDFSGSKLTASGTFSYDAQVKVGLVTFLNVASAKSVLVNGKAVDAGKVKYSAATKSLVATTGISLKSGFTVELK